MLTGTKTHILGAGNTCAVFEVCNLTHQIFVADYSPNPTIRVFDQNLTERSAFTDVCALEIRELVFDNQKNRLYVVCGSPELQVRVVDLTASKVVDFKEGHALTVTENYLGLAVNPKNRKFVVILDKRGLVVYNIGRSHHLKNGQLTECLGVELLRLDYPELVSTPLEGEDFSDMYWDVNGRLYLATSQSRVSVFCMEKMEVVEQIMFENSVCFMGRVDHELYVVNNSK